VGPENGMTEILGDYADIYEVETYGRSVCEE